MRRARFPTCPPQRAQAAPGKAEPGLLSAGLNGWLPEHNRRIRVTADHLAAA
jgi:hypothetical protein